MVEDQEGSKFKWSSFSKDEYATDLWVNYIYVSYKAEWCDQLIADHFLWPKDNKNVYDMKIFGTLFLAEHLGQRFKDYESH